MKADFPSSLRDRFLPSVFCYSSDEVALERPNWRTLVKTAWEEALGDSTLRFRIVFPTGPDSKADISKALVDARTGQPRHNAPVELDTTLVLRNTYLQSAAPCDFFPDLPSSILVILKGKEKTTIPESLSPLVKHKWRTIKKSSVRLGRSNLVDVLSEWIRSTVRPSYTESVLRVEREYEAEWVGVRQTLVDFFGSRSDPMMAARCLKMYADLQMQRQMYEEAGMLYKRLVGAVADMRIVAHGNLCIAFSDVLRGSMTEETLGYVRWAVQSCQDVAPHVMLCWHTEFYVRCRIRMAPAKAITYTRMRSPFMLEQLALFSKRRHAALFLWLAATRYFALDMVPFGLECLRDCVSDFRGYDWPYLSQRLNQSMLERSKEHQIEMIVDIVNANRLTIPKELMTFLESFSTDFPLPCRFVHGRIVDCYTHGFLGTPIRGSELDWDRIGERLFGAYYSGSFFDYKKLTKREVCVGEPVMFRIVIKMPSAVYDLINLSLLVRGTANIIVAPVNVAAASISFHELCVTPTSPGDFEVYGVSCLWANLVNIEAPLSQLSTRVFVHEKAPKVELCVKSYISDELYVGQVTKIDLTLRNVSLFPLKSLSLCVIDESIVKLVSPEVDDICGQYRLTSLASDEEIELRIGIQIMKAGSHTVNLIFPYWAADLPARYEYLTLTYHVYPQPNTVIQRSLTGLQTMAPEYCWARGFAGPQADLDSHLLVLDGRCAVLNLVSMEIKDNKTNTDDYVFPFLDRSKLTCMYENVNGVVLLPIERPSTHVAMLLRKVQSI